MAASFFHPELRTQVRGSSVYLLAAVWSARVTIVQDWVVVSGQPTSYQSDRCVPTARKVCVMRE